MRLGTNALFASALFTAWACAHQTGSDLGGSASDNPAGKGGSAAKGGTGGSSASGGSGGSSASSTGGTSASAGKGGTGTGGSSTGGSATGGSATGGSATGGSGNTSARGGSGGGTAGDTANGGQAGDDTIPPDVLANADVVLRYIARGHADTANAVDTQLFFENKSDDPLPLSQVKVRYWTTFEAGYGNLNCYFAAIIGASNVTLDVVDDGPNTHVLIGFKAGEVPAHNSSPFTNTEFQMKVDATGSGLFDQSNDWSFDGGATETSPPAPNGKITVYLADKLIWGCEPSKRCAGDDGAGGQGGQGGQAGETSTGGTGTGGSISAGQGGEPNAGQGGA